MGVNLDLDRSIPSFLEVNRRAKCNCRQMLYDVLLIFPFIVPSLPLRRVFKVLLPSEIKTKKSKKKLLKMNCHVATVNYRLLLYILNIADSAFDQIPFLRL